MQTTGAAPGPRVEVPRGRGGRREPPITRQTELGIQGSRSTSAGRTPQEESLGDGSGGISMIHGLGSGTARGGPNQQSDFCNLTSREEPCSFVNV